jgi:hypothetical protein
MEFGCDDFLRARSAIFARRTEIRAKALARPTHGANRDHGAMRAADHEGEHSAPLACHIIYRDDAGALSGRCIVIRSLRPCAGDLDVFAYCQLRGALRQFRASRILEAVDLATGEIFTPGLAYLASHGLLAGAAADGEYDSAMAVAACRDEVTVLTVLAGADGRFEEDEEDRIVIHVMDRFPDPGVEENGVRARIRAFAPDEGAFHAALRRLGAGLGDAHALMRTIRQLVDCDGRLALEEIMFVEAIERELAAAEDQA